MSSFKNGDQVIHDGTVYDFDGKLWTALPDENGVSSYWGGFNEWIKTQTPELHRRTYTHDITDMYGNKKTITAPDDPRLVRPKWNEQTGRFESEDGRVFDPTSGQWIRMSNPGYQIKEIEVKPLPKPKQSPAHYMSFQNNGLASLKSRQDWVKNNAEYLMNEHGWTENDIESYQGLNLTNAQRAKLNMRLAGQIAGAKAWNEGRAARQTEAARQEGARIQKYFEDHTPTPYETPNSVVGLLEYPNQQKIENMGVRKELPEVVGQDKMVSYYKFFK